MLVFDVQVAYSIGILNGMSQSRIAKANAHKARGSRYNLSLNERADAIAAFGCLQLLKYYFYLFSSFTLYIVRVDLHPRHNFAKITNCHYGGLIYGDHIKGAIIEQPQYGLHNDNP